MILMPSPCSTRTVAVHGLSLFTNLRCSPLSLSGRMSGSNQHMNEIYWKVIASRSAEEDHLLFLWQGHDSVSEAGRRKFGST